MLKSSNVKRIFAMGAGILGVDGGWAVANPEVVV